MPRGQSAPLGYIQYHRAMLASAKTNGIGPNVHIQALSELGTGGE